MTITATPSSSHTIRPARRRRARFKGVVSYTLFGGVSVPFELYASAWVNPSAAFGTGAPGFAFAYLDPTVTVGGVPEPASWAMMIAGFGLVGGAMRRRLSASICLATSSRD